ncbi:hypothetical protein RhiirA5_434884 [Rhizophagus irregularis]|uniref:Uncharacterized protein n=1 Tax=Rhizophagus irregularis TaxID=588596 RepID=A0A2I1FBJ7_9GLOM|nr:hypothetical protein RhiirA5_434884 [Rhizophagus irregularis]PKC56215.1 hypothetical protein RhiirA1_474322 [Rhizophagus irregularis]PKY31765.1 hypothetical protein RhiirB3_449538 [Rhizophagus irregularis]
MLKATNKKYFWDLTYISIFWGPGELLPVKENLRLFERPPKGLSEKLPDEENLGPVKENPGFEKFEEGLLDNKSDGKNHKKNKKKV